MQQTKVEQKFDFLTFILKLSSILTPPFEDPDAMYACLHILAFRVRISY